jgi:hypothetical protein
MIYLIASARLRLLTNQLSLSDYHSQMQDEPQATHPPQGWHARYGRQ